MEDAMGVEQRRIGQEVADSNLLKETIGKVGVLHSDGKVRYPASVSYDMGWQKAKKTYDSLSGHGLMIGDRTKNVVAFQNFSKACLKCDLHRKNMSKLKTPDVPVEQHHCPKNYSGSSKGMEAQAALDCVNQIWTHEEIVAFIDVVCIDDDATTRAYLAHCFRDLELKGLPRPKTKSGKIKTGARNDKGKLGKDHPVIIFLADLSHRVRTYGKYLFAMKNMGAKRSPMTEMDALRLKRNFAWWLFSGASLTYDEFSDAAMSPVLHHFNDHSKCGTWCRHKNKSAEQLSHLDKYRNKEKDSFLYSQCVELIERFTSESHLRECHHKMSSQKNEAMNKSIMRYCPKDKTYSKSMALTSRLCLAIAIDTVGHSEYYVRLFAAMKLQATELTFSGLRRMWRKKEYGRMRQGRKQVKLDRRIAIRKSILKGIDELEKDKEEGRAYESGIRMAGDDDNENDKQSGEPRAKKRAKTGATKDNNKKERRTASLS
jgi:hypothetical protein